MQNRDGQGLYNPPFQHASRVAATNDGTLNAIVNKAVCSVDLPLGKGITSHRNDEMLSWLHYPAEDSLDRGYCSDIFGDLPSSSGHLMRPPFHEPKPQNFHFNTGTPIFSSILSHGASSSFNTCTTEVSQNTRDAVESCGSGPVEACFRVAGADAVLGLGVCQATEGTPSRPGLEGCSKWKSEGEAMRRAEHVEQLTHNSEGSQTLSHVSSLREGTLVNMTALSFKPKSLDAMDCDMPPMPSDKRLATNFALFSRTAVESKVSLDVLKQSSGPTNIERVRLQTGPVQLLNSTCTMQLSLGGEMKCLPPPTPLRPLLPLLKPLPPLLPSPCSSSAALERSSLMHARQLPALPPPPSSIGESRDETNVRKDTVTCSRMSITSADSRRTTDSMATSPSRCSGCSTGERSGKITENVSTKPKLVPGDDSEYQSEYVEDMAAMDKKSRSSNSKRMRTAEMHNQSERKRRVKINDKLKILQQLIPNSNKPDKASLLDAVIEYIKVLQAQLQMISMRTGIGIPSWMIPNVNMQHLQVPSYTQMRLTTDMGMGMGVGLGMGMRMGMGMMDANVAAVGTGCTMMPVPLFPGPPPTPHATALQSAERMQSPGAMNIYIGPSHILHPSMNQNVPMYHNLQQPQSQRHPQPQLFHPQLSQLPGDPGKRPYR